MAHPHTIAAREDKAAHAAALGITEARISDLVEGFYEKVRSDAVLGPIFSKKITNWPPHLARMKDFWASIAIESGRFRGNPMVKHLAIPGIERAHFDHWLTLFDETLPEVMPNAAACQFLSERAARIADSLMTGISIHRDGLPNIKQKRRRIMLLDENNMAVQSDEYYHEHVPHEIVALAASTQPEARTFGIPTVIWGSMAASYALFFFGLVLGTGHDGRALFMIAISMLYAVMYFGTAFVLNSLGASDRTNQKSQWSRGKFDTHTGRMSFGAVYGQMLVVPIVFAIFGLGIAVIRFAVM